MIAGTAGFLALAAPAHGATVTYSAELRFGLDSIQYRAAPGEHNQLRLYHDSSLHESLRMVNLTDSLNPIQVTGSGGEFDDPVTRLTQCIAVPIAAAYCRFRNVTNPFRTFTVSAFLGDRNDLGRVSYVSHPEYSLVFHFNGEEGDDQLIGSPEHDSFFGGPGADRIDAGAGDDSIGVGDGEADIVDCGPGNDRVTSADPIDQLTDCEDVPL